MRSEDTMQRNRDKRPERSATEEREHACPDEYGVRPSLVDECGILVCAD